ncbi:HTH-type transcriptional regulator / antitoxin HigA [Aquiflexum balticum DSM 16537]|jgi:HTH-type transcriptional regulator / antitoxin HigA|uniref:HTH-type transcriptional regulator / antitoxin HigA n=1 Tax=Aquiflexum balticum DSM 16537 TaxID=758820 RepID=A0A1W2H8B1_9BACT|nr:helix-turn-helix domain-containing protein [Aquiflexum balticum]SMD45044.1 HTH-type transcriptional regulator / antitoxin HigA [Aquiflexum balticum DSM 16537]
MKNFTIIRSENQYLNYCDELEKLSNEYSKNPNQDLIDLIDTITLLIENYDESNSTFEESEPIQLLKFLMQENNLNQKELAETLEISKGHLSDILNYKKGLSKNMIRSLSERFKMQQSAFNRPYELKSVSNNQLKSAGLRNSQKETEKV